MLRDFEAEQVSVYTSLARKLTGQVAKKLIKNLNAAAGKADQSYTKLIKGSLAFPKTVLQCPATPQCRMKRYRETLVHYQGQLMNLRRLSLFIIQQGYDALGTQKQLSEKKAVTRRVKQLYKAAYSKSRALPRASDICS